MPARYWLFLHLALYLSGVPLIEHQEYAAFGCLHFPVTLSSPSGWALILSPAGGFAQTLRGDCTPQYLHHKITDLRREQGEGVGEQTNLYKLQSYSIYKAQTEAEPWGTEDGNNLQSRFAWSCAAFESSDSSKGGDRRDAGDTWVAGSTSASHSTLPAPCSCRVRLLPQGTKAILVLFRPDSP